MVVPPIGFDSIVILPFTNRTRSRILVRPRPLPCDAASTSKPLPKSLMIREIFAGVFPQLDFNPFYPAVLDGVIEGFNDPILATNVQRIEKDPRSTCIYITAYTTQR